MLSLASIGGTCRFGTRASSNANWADGAIAPAVDYLIRTRRVSCDDVYSHAIRHDAVNSFRLLVEKHAFDVTDPYALLNACFKDSARIAAFLVNRLGIDAAANDNNAFIAACFRGSLKTATYLASLPAVDVRAKRGEPLLSAVRWGNLDVVKFLTTLPTIDIHAHDDKVFQDARLHGHLNVLAFLESPRV